MCYVDRQALERDLSSLRWAHLRPLFKLASVDGISAKDHRNFLEAPRVMILMSKSGGRLKFKAFLSDANGSFPKLRVLKFSHLC